MYVTSVRLSDELADAVKLYCSRTGASVNGAVVVGLERLVAGDANLARLEAPAPAAAVRDLTVGERNLVGLPVGTEAPPSAPEQAPAVVGFCKASGCLKRGRVDGFCEEHAG